MTGMIPFTGGLQGEHTNYATCRDCPVPLLLDCRVVRTMVFARMGEPSQ